MGKQWLYATFFPFDAELAFVLVPKVIVEAFFCFVAIPDGIGKKPGCEFDSAKLHAGSIVCSCSIPFL